MWLFLTVPWVGLQYVIMVFPGHTPLPLGRFFIKRSQVKLSDYICTSALEIISISANYQIIEPVHEISNNVVCATIKASDQPTHTRSLIRAFSIPLSIL